MQSTLGKAIFKTLIYADLFDYSLTWEEIWDRLIECNNVTMEQCNNGINKIKIIQEKEGHFFLKDREHIISIRKKRVKYSQEKLRIAKKTASLLRFIPSVKLVGVTGALAVSNAGKDDDIDLLIVTSRGLLWTTRLLVTLLIELTGKRRHPKEKQVENKICLNMFIDENHLAVPKGERDIFTAYEAVQMKPLFDKEGTYRKFLEANWWVKNYLPNAINNQKPRTPSASLRAGKNQEPKKKKFLVLSSSLKTHQGRANAFPWCGEIRKLFIFIEKTLKSFQLWYMRKRRTTEVITDGIIRFHPQDAREWVLKNYKERLKTYKLVK